MNPEGGFMIPNPVVLLLRKLMKKEQNKKSLEKGSFMLIIMKSFATCTKTAK